MWPEIPDGALLVVPLGSTEQHGHHLPLGTDTSVAWAVADAAAGAIDGSLLAPALAYGASGEHEDFPGTVSLGTEALTGLLVEYGRSAGRWAGRVLLVNGHGGNHDALRAAGTVLRAEGRDVAWFPCGVPGGDAHAGRTETSLMLHVEPEGVLGDAGDGRRRDADRRPAPPPPRRGRPRGQPDRRPRRPGGRDRRRGRGPAGRPRAASGRRRGGLGRRPDGSSQGADDARATVPAG